MKKITRTVVPEICIALGMFGVTMLPPSDVIGIWALIIATFGLTLLLLRMNKYRRDAAARMRMTELADAFTQSNEDSTRH